MRILTPDERAELRGLLHNHNADPGDWCCDVLPQAAMDALPALLDAADERDRLADSRDQWQEMRHDAVGEASRRWPEGTIRASRWDGIMIDGERSLLVQREAFVAGAEWVALHEAPQLRSTVERVRELHRAVGIYDACECTDDEKETGHTDVEEVGLTCNKLYDICAECCRDDVYQTETCADHHEHRLGEARHCPTITALDGDEQ